MFDPDAGARHSARLGGLGLDALVDVEHLFGLGLHAQLDRVADLRALTRRRERVTGGVCTLYALRPTAWDDVRFARLFRGRRDGPSTCRGGLGFLARARSRLYSSKRAMISFEIRSCSLSPTYSAENFGRAFVEWIPRGSRVRSPHSRVGLGRPVGP